MLQRIAASYREAYRGVPRNVWLIALTLLVSRSGTMVLPFLSIYVTRELGFRPLDVGWLLATYGLGAIGGGLLGGWLTARCGAMRVQIGSLALSMPGFVVLGQLDHFLSVCIGLFCLSIAIEAFRPACGTATVNFCSHRSQHTRAMAVNRLAVNLGMSIGPPVGGFLAALNYELLFWANAATAGAAMLLMLVLFGWKADSAITGSSGSGTRSADQPTKEGPDTGRSPWADPRYLVFLLFNILGAVVFFQFLGTYPLYLNEQYRLQEHQIGLLYGVNTVVIVLFELVLINYVRRFSMMRIFAWGQLLSCLGFGLLPLAAGAEWAVACAWCVATMLILTLGEMLSMPIGMAYVAQRSTTTNRGPYMGLYSTSFSVALLVSPVIGLKIYEINPHLLWYLCLILGAGVFLGLLAIADREDRDVRQSADGG